VIVLKTLLLPAVDLIGLLAPTPPAPTVTV
jgi:hypothetical protein